MTLNPNDPARAQLALTALMTLALFTFTSCSSPHPAPKLGAAPVEGSAGLGSEVMVNSATATAIVISIDATARQIVLKRPDGRLAHCRARPGVVAFTGIKVGDTVSIGVAEELALAIGKTGLPSPTAQDATQVRVRVPVGVEALAEAVEVLSFTAKVVSIDDWNDSVTLRLADGQTRTVRVSEAVNLANLTPGDDVSVQITDAVALIVTK